MAPIVEVSCPACSSVVACDPRQMVERLRECGAISRHKHPADELLDEIFRGAAPRLRCRACGATGLVVGRPIDDDAPWAEAPPCEDCGRVIPRERRGALPDAMVCAECQRRRESGQSPDEPEFCPRCGGLMRLVRRRGAGVARFAMRCSDCGR